MACMRSSREHQQQHWAAGHKQICRKLALGIAAGLHVRAENEAALKPAAEEAANGIQEESGSAQALRLVPSRMVCPYGEFLALWSAAESSPEPPTGLINLGNRWRPQHLCDVYFSNIPHALSMYFTQVHLAELLLHMIPLL